MKAWFGSILGMLLMSTLSGCAVLVAHVENDPFKAQPNGERVNIFVARVLDTGGVEDVTNSILGKKIALYASDWLRKCGYQIQSGFSSRVDSTVRFILQEKMHDEYVPGRTYSTPIYGNAGTTTSTVTNSYGATIGTIQTQSSNAYLPTAYQSNYVEGHNQTVRDRYLHIFVDAWTKGAPPVVVSQGEVFPEKRNQKFFEDPAVMKEAVEKALKATVFGKTFSAPIHTEDRPGCWPRIGIAFDQSEKLEKGLRIKSFTHTSLAGESGLKVGDIVYSIDGHVLPYKSPPTIQENALIPVEVERDGKTKTYQVKSLLMCVEDS